MELKMVGNSGTVNATDDIFGREFNEALVHQVVVAYQANARVGSRAQKDRGAVNHSTKKPWRQKGTGRARAGMTSSPLWRGGGKIFPNSPDENFAQKVRSMGFDGVLVITDEIDQNLLLSSRNLPNVEVVSVRHANPVALVRFPNVLLTKAALAKLEEMLK